MITQSTNISADDVEIAKLELMVEQLEAQLSEYSYQLTCKHERIEELEAAMQEFVDNYENYDTAHWYHYCGRVAPDKFRQLLEEPSGNSGEFEDK